MRSAPKLLLSLLAVLALGSALVLAVPQGARDAEPPRQPRNLAILLFEGVQIIDYTGPYEVFGHAMTSAGHAFNIYTVAEKPGPITTAMDMTVIPRYTFKDAPPPDVLVLPGGGVDDHLENPAVMRWIRDSAEHSEVVLSVCNGAFFLAKAGLLDGLEATTFAGLIDELRTAAPKTRVVEDRRFVDNGKIVTAAGLSSGIDGSLHVIEKLLGKGNAQRVALGLEYNWQPDSGWARAALPDRLVRVDTPDDVPGEPLLSEGTTDRWEKQWSVATNLSKAEFFEQINRNLATSNKWTRGPGTGAQDASEWTFTDHRGRPWNGHAAVEPLAPGKLKLTLRIFRSS